MAITPPPADEGRAAGGVLGGCGSVELGGGGIGIAVVADGDGCDFAEIDVAPDGGAVVVGIDDLQIPDAAGCGVVEGDVGGFAIGDGGLAEDIGAPGIGLAGGDEELGELVAGAVDEVEILLGGLRRGGGGEEGGGEDRCRGGDAESPRKSEEHSGVLSQAVAGVGVPLAGCMQP